MNLGSFLGRVGQGIGGGIRKGIGKLGEMGGEDGEMPFPIKKPMPMTPGFNPDAAMPSLKAPMIGADSGTIGHDPRLRNPLPQLQRPDAPMLPPVMPTTRGSVDIEGQLPAGQVSVTPQQTQMIAQRPIGEVRPPDFLGRKGATMDDTPLNHERYAYENQYMKDGRHPRRWQDIAMTALHGANEGFKATGDWRGALAGAGTGAAGAAISPLAARDLRFDREQLPGLERSRIDMERGQDRSFEMQKRNADLEGSRARTAATIAGTKDAELERSKLSSLIKLNEAKRLALESGKVQVVEIEDPQTGQVRLLRVNNDGSVDLGASGRAAMNTDRIESREKIAGNQIKSREGIADKQIGARKVVVGMQQGGANYRAGMSQSGQNNRQKERLGAQYGDTYVPPQGAAPPVGSVPNLFPGINPPVASGKVATQKDIADYAKMKGISPADARKKFEDKGYSIQ